MMDDMDHVMDYGYGSAVKRGSLPYYMIIS